MTQLPVSVFPLIIESFFHFMFSFQVTSIKCIFLFFMKVKIKEPFVIVEYALVVITAVDILCTI